MVKLTAEMKESFAGAKHFYIATSAKNIPNVVPVSFLKVYDDETLLISNQFLDKTLKNLQENPHIAISFWGDKGGFQIKGTASIHKGDQIFEKNVELAKERYPRFTPKSGILVEITDVFVIKAGAEAGKKIL